MRYQRIKIWADIQSAWLWNIFSFFFLFLSKVIILRNKSWNATERFVFQWGNLAEFNVHWLQCSAGLFFKSTNFTSRIYRSTFSDSFSIRFWLVCWLIENHQVLSWRRIILIIKPHVTFKHNVCSLWTSLLDPTMLRLCHFSILFQK